MSRDYSRTASKVANSAIQKHATFIFSQVDASEKVSKAEGKVVFGNTKDIFVSDCNQITVLLICSRRSDSFLVTKKDYSLPALLD